MSIKEMWSNFCNNYEANHAAKKGQEAVKIAKDSIQIREFEGKLYISYNDKPIVMVERLNKDALEVLCECRCAFANWMLCHKS